jgi:hypothetical protein
MLLNLRQYSKLQQCRRLKQLARLLRHCAQLCQLLRSKGRSLPTPMINQRINIGSLDFNDHFL